MYTATLPVVTGGVVLFVILGNMAISVLVRQLYATL